MIDHSLKTRMGTRLSALFNAIPETTTEFWDLCCDHGAAGRAILESRPSCPVVFNDIHSDIMAHLEHQLAELAADNYRLAICPAERLELTASRQPTLLLAGVGAEQCIVILAHLFAQPASASATFIISPATKMYWVRQFLIEQGAYLLAEQVVTEHNRSYEILTIRREPTSSGLAMIDHPDFSHGDCWLPADPNHRRHINKLIAYYGAQLEHRPTPQSKAIVQGYQNILKKLSGQT